MQQVAILYQQAQILHSAATQLQPSNHPDACAQLEELWHQSLVFFDPIFIYWNQELCDQIVQIGAWNRQVQAS